MLRPATSNPRLPPTINEDFDLDDIALQDDNPASIKLGTVQSSITRFTKQLGERGIKIDPKKLSELEVILSSIKEIATTNASNENINAQLEGFTANIDALLDQMSDRSNNQQEIQMFRSVRKLTEDLRISMTAERPATDFHRIMIFCVLLSTLGRFLAFSADPGAVWGIILTVASSLAYSTLAIDAIADIPKSLKVIVDFFKNSSIANIILSSTYILSLLAASTSDSLRTGYEAYYELGKGWATLAAFEFISVFAIGCAGYKSIKKLIVQTLKAPTYLKKLSLLAPSGFTIPSAWFFPMEVEQWTNGVLWIRKNCLADHGVKQLAMTAHGLTQWALETEGVNKKISQAKYASNACRGKNPAAIEKCKEQLQLTCNFMLLIGIGVLLGLALYGVGNYQYTLGQEARNITILTGTNDTNYKTCRRYANVTGWANLVLAFSNLFLVLLAADKAPSSMRKIAGAFSMKAENWIKTPTSHERPATAHPIEAAPSTSELEGLQVTYL